MIEVSTLAQKLQEKLNTNDYGVVFDIAVDTGEIKKPKRIINSNDFEYPINGLFTVVSSEIGNITDGQIVATMGVRFQCVVPIVGEEEDQTFKVVTPNGDENVTVVKGYGDKVKAIRNILDVAFIRNEQEVLTDSNGINYSTMIQYALVNSGMRNQVAEIGDSFVFSAVITYMFVENGISTQDMVYTLDGKRIPFQAHTLYRTPNMDGNVYANTINGAVKNTTSQTVFSVAFELPALKNDITERAFEFLFGGKMNVAHLLNVSYPSPLTGETVSNNYLVTFGEIKAMGEEIKNMAQNLTLVEIDDDYELISFPSDYHIYECTTSTNTVAFTETAYFYNADTREFGSSEDQETATLSFAVGDYLVSTAPLLDTSNFTEISNA